ncbi:hypothetical protein DFJ77DRAFT_27181 [Powellomyces hirtus]|nr:hypothetical protein DFJ77DRAFT_27181 [Powellomyces hirtus]
MEICRKTDDLDKKYSLDDDFRLLREETGAFPLVDFHGAGFQGIRNEYVSVHYHEDPIRASHIAEALGLPFTGERFPKLARSFLDIKFNIGKKEGFEDLRSVLLFEFVRLVKETQTRYFIFENVRSVLPESKHTISDQLGVSAVKLNSSVFTAQVRGRLFWCNFHVDVPVERVAPALSDILGRKSWQ